MNQAIQFPDREEWDAKEQAILFPALVNGMQLMCVIKGDVLLRRFGGAARFCGKSLGSRGRGQRSHQ